MKAKNLFSIHKATIYQWYTAASLPGNISNKNTRFQPFQRNQFGGVISVVEDRLPRVICPSFNVLKVQIAPRSNLPFIISKSTKNSDLELVDWQNLIWSLVVFILILYILSSNHILACLGGRLKFCLILQHLMTP